MKKHAYVVSQCGLSGVKHEISQMATRETTEKEEETLG